MIAGGPLLSLPLPTPHRLIGVKATTFFAKSIKVEKNQGNLERHGLDVAAQYARFIFAREEVVWKSILNCLSMWIMIIVLEIR
jgi:hypothetical protein